MMPLFSVMRIGLTLPRAVDHMSDFPSSLISMTLPTSIPETSHGSYSPSSLIALKIAPSRFTTTTRVPVGKASPSSSGSTRR